VDLPVNAVQMGFGKLLWIIVVCLMFIVLIMQQPGGSWGVIKNPDKKTKVIY